MSFKAFVWAWEQEVANAAELLVLLTLADISGETGQVYASHTYIARRCRRSERHVRSVINDLDGRFIRVTERQGRTDLIALVIPKEFTVKMEGHIFEGAIENGKRGRPRKARQSSDEKSGNLASQTPEQIADEPLGEPTEEPKKGLTSLGDLFPEKPKSTNGSRIPEGWEPDQNDINFAASQGLSERETDRVAEDFRDYWIARPGAGGRKLDWPATWRGWVRRHCERRGGSGVASGQNPRTGGRPIVGTGEILARGRGFFEDGA